MGFGHDSVGVVVGKFNPPHLGHLHLIEQGAAQVGELPEMRFVSRSKS